MKYQEKETIESRKKAKICSLSLVFEWVSLSDNLQIGREKKRTNDLTYKELAEYKINEPKKCRTAANKI